MVDLDKLSGCLIRSGRFKESIEVFLEEINTARDFKRITIDEWYNLHVEFCHLLLVPDAEKAHELGTKMLALAMRLPGVLEAIDDTDFNEELEKSRSEAG